MPLLRGPADVAHTGRNDHLIAMFVGKLINRAETGSSTAVFGKTANREMDAIRTALAQRVQELLAHQRTVEPIDNEARGGPAVGRGNTGSGTRKPDGYPGSDCAA